MLLCKELQTRTLALQKVERNYSLQQRIQNVQLCNFHENLEIWEQEEIAQGSGTHSLHEQDYGLFSKDIKYNPECP